MPFYRERKVDVARELGYRDGGSVLQIIKRLHSRSQKDNVYSLKIKKS